MSDLSMFDGDETLKEVKAATEMYEACSGMQDVFMQCLKDAYKMGYLEWKMMRLESHLNLYRS
jgi:hypothetical protein